MALPSAGAGTRANCSAPSRSTASPARVPCQWRRSRRRAWAVASFTESAHVQVVLQRAADGWLRHAEGQRVAALADLQARDLQQVDLTGAVGQGQRVGAGVAQRRPVAGLARLGAQLVED